MPKYPAQIDTSQSLPTAVDNFTPVQGAVFNKLRDAVLSIETELGVKPSGIYSNVAGRLNNLEGIVGNLQIIEIQEDLGGTLESPLVVGLQGRPVSTIAPSVGQVLSWNGIAWVPGAGGEGGGGGTLFVDQLTPPLNINLQTTSLVEVGQTVVNPAFTADYHFFPSLAVTPQSAFLVDSDNSFSQNVESTPNAFNSIFSFTKNVFGDIVTFTLTATVAPITKAQPVTITWAQKLYWGLGTAGGSGAGFITSLTGQQLTTTKDFAFAVNTGPTDKVYFSCRSAYGPVVFTVHDVEGGFTKTGTFSVTNGHGFSENYDLYESDNVNLGSIIVITGEGDDEFIGGGGPVGPPGPPGASGIDSAVIFDDFVPSAKSNIRTNRVFPSSITNTFTGITDLGNSSDLVGGAVADYSTISGGDSNATGGTYSTVSGGKANVAAGLASTISGGQTSTASGDYATIGGGLTNTAGGQFSTISGGSGNFTILNNSTIAGGTSNAVNGLNSFIGGGFNNIVGADVHAVPSDNSTISGGNVNFSDAVGSFIGGGNNNHQGTIYGVIAGGKNNAIGSAGVSFGARSYCTIGGGFDNIIDQLVDGATIPGGQDAHARISGQLAYASGAFAVNGDAQISVYLVKGEDPTGSGVTLVGLGGASLPLQNGFTYTIRATCTANRIDAQGSATFIHTMLVHATGGAATIDSTNTTLSIPNGQTWTIGYTTTGLSLVATFQGTGGQDVRAMVKYEISEVGGGP